RGKREKEEPDWAGGLDRPALEASRVHEGIVVEAVHVGWVTQPDGEGAEHGADGGGRQERWNGKQPPPGLPGEDREGRQPGAAAIESALEGPQAAHQPERGAEYQVATDRPS